MTVIFQLSRNDPSLDGKEIEKRNITHSKVNEMLPSPSKGGKKKKRNVRV